MEVENHSKWKETIILEIHPFSTKNHDYGRKGKPLLTNKQSMTSLTIQKNKATKKTTYYFPLYLLGNKDPYNGLF